MGAIGVADADWSTRPEAWGPHFEAHVRLHPHVTEALA